MNGKILKEIREIKNFSKESIASSCKISVKELEFIENNNQLLDKRIIKEFSNSLKISEAVLTFLNLDENDINFKEEYIQLKPVVENFLINLTKNRNIVK